MIVISKDEVLEAISWAIEQKHIKGDIEMLFRAINECEEKEIADTK